MLAVAGESGGTQSFVFSYTRPANEVIQSGSPLTLGHAHQIRAGLSARELAFVIASLATALMC